MLPHDATGFYKLVYVVLSAWLALIGKLRVEGREHIPRTGGVVLVCNHTGGVDFVALGLALTRQVHFMGKEEAWGYNRLLALILKWGGAISVRRGAGDLEALRLAVSVVQAGRVLGMFPEGTRSKTGALQRGHTGATRIALESGVPVLPAAVINARAPFANFPRFWRRPVVTVRFGAPFTLAGKAARDRAAVAQGTRQIMASIACLLPAELRGSWGESM
jgi:1-acyl-sn-glycerol-3-phosphate acyltransferase